MSEAPPTEIATAPPRQRAPVQGYSAGIPWSIHLRAYDAYCQKYGEQPALIDLEGKNCRGGFGVEELDEFIPGWRDEVAEITLLRERAAAAEARGAALREANEWLERNSVLRNPAQQSIADYLSALGESVRLQGTEDAYEPPEDGWVCFHCGVRFLTQRAAVEHFGVDPNHHPECTKTPTPPAAETEFGSQGS